MESKKINQLATELAPDLSDLTIIGDPTTGISKKITLSQMASLFTGTVEEYATLAAFPLVGVADTIYIALDTNVIYRYDTSLSAYVILSPNIINSLVFSDANGFDGTITLVGSVATLSITTALTLGSVPFIGASGALTQDNANLFFDDTNNRLGIATASPTTPLDVFGSGIIGRLNATSTNNAYLGFASNGTNKWSAGNVQSDHRFRIFSEANSAELITILQTGEFGIGIANPLTKLHIDGGATALIANLDADVSVAKTLSFRSDNSNRINLEVSGTESGSNAGADFFLRTYTDAGSLLATPLTITRSTGAATFSNSITAAGNITTSLSQAATTDISVTNTNASNGAAAQISAISGGASQIDMVAFGSGSTGTLYGITKANLKVIRDNSLTAQTNGLAIGTDAAVPLYFFANSTEYMRLLSSGSFLINMTSSTGNAAKLQVTGGIGVEVFNTSKTKSVYIAADKASSISLISSNYNTSPYLPLAISGRESISDLVCMPTGNILIGTTTESFNGEKMYIVLSGGAPLGVDRLSTDGGLLRFYQDGTQEGNISVAGTTVSYNSFLGSHWSQLQDGSKIEILKGTIIEAIDEMCIWEDETNDRLPKSKISNTAESKNVYGIFLAWDEDWETSNDFYVAAVGLGYIRINSSQNISMGDLLQSNGDGTAKVQSDDIMRSSTIAKVVSTKKIETYEDGSYLIAATLHCG